MARLPAVSIAALAAALGGCGSDGPSPVPEPSIAPESGWSAAAPMLEARQEVCTAAIGPRVYVAGGFRTDGGTAATLEVYDTATDRWTLLAPMPEALNHCTAAAVGSRLFVFGGARGNGATSGATLEYDPAANAWSVRTPMPTARAAAMAAAAGPRVYVAGGTPGGRALEVYDVGADAWLSLPPMPTGRDHLAGGFASGRVFAAGGRPPLTLAAMEAFDVASGAWSAATPMPTGRSGHAAAVVRGCLYAIGGEGNPGNPNGVFPQVQVYDPRANRWETLPDMPSPRHGMGAAVVDDRIWVPGGATVQGFGAVGTNHVFTPPADRACF